MPPSNAGVAGRARALVASAFAGRVPWRRLLAAAALVAVGVAGWRYRRELAAAAGDLRALGVGVLLVFPLFWLWNHAAALGWRGVALAVHGADAPSIWRLSLIRLEAQALNLVLPLAGACGEALKAALAAGGRNRLAPAATAVALDTTAATVAEVLFATLGVALGWRLVPVTGAALGAAVGGGLALAAALWWLPFALPRLLHAHRREGSILRRALWPLAQAAGGVRPAFARSVAWHGLERLLTAAEVWLVAHALGHTLGIADAVFATAVLTAASVVFFFVPAQAGAAEAGLALAFGALGLPPTVGLAVALVRRGRQVVVAAVGLGALLLWEGRAARVSTGSVTGPVTPIAGRVPVSAGGSSCA